MKVFVYFNLHKKVWSIKALEGDNKGRVIGYAKAVHLANVVPKVSEAGRQRVIQEGKKNVHAGLCGDLMEVDQSSNLWSDYPHFGTMWDVQGMSKITYNPFRFETFVDKTDTDLGLTKADAVFMLGNRDVYQACGEFYSISASKQLEMAI